MNRLHFAVGIFAMSSLVSAQETQWFHQGLDAALTEAGSAKARMVLLYCWVKDHGDCTSFYEGTVLSKEAVAEMADFVCVGAEKGETAGAALHSRFRVERVPCVLFLKPDGSVEDVLTGVLTASAFVAEVKRIKSGKDTMGALRAAAVAKPGDLALQLALARKLRASGDRDAAEKIVDAILEKDPKAQSEPGGEALLLRICDATFKPEITPQDVDLKDLREFLVKQKHKRILFLGWDRVMAAEWRREDIKAATHAATQAWKIIPPEEVMDWGNRVVAQAYVLRKDLDKGQEKMMLDIAKRTIAEAEKAAKSRADGNQFLADRLYTLASAQYVNNLRKEAFATMERAMQLDPANENLKKALEAWKSGAK